MSVMSSGPNGTPVRDAAWVGKMFLANLGAIEAKYRNLAIATTAHSKFTGTRIGDNWAINNPPHYCRHADPRVTSLVTAAGEVGTTGMGQFYSEQLDDNAHLVHMCLGHANFKGMIAFFTGMGDIGATLYARTGRTSIGYILGKVAGVYLGFRLLPLMLVGMTAKYILNRGSSKYYSFRPAMHSYWKRVNFIANSYAVSTGLYNRIPNWGHKSYEEEMDPSMRDKAITESEVNQISLRVHEMCPEIFKKNGTVDVYQMAMKSQILASRRREELKKMANKINGTLRDEELVNLLALQEFKSAATIKSVSLSESESIEDLLRRAHEGVGDPVNSEIPPIGSDKFDEDTWDKSLQGAKDHIQTAESMTIQTAQESNAAYAEQQANGTAVAEGQYPPEEVNPTNEDGTVSQPKSMVYDFISSTSEQLSHYMGAFNLHYVAHGEAGEDKVEKGWLYKLWNGISSAYHGSYEWITFRVEPTGSISSSVSNSSRESDISSMINGFSATMAGHRFTFSNGATGLPILDAAMRQIGDGIRGFLDGFDAMGVINLAGSSYVDIPEHWESSSTTFPSESFKMPLRCQYANKLSRYLKLYIPLSMVQAFSFPISTGRQSYTSPYMCQVYSPGRMSCKLGMVESMSLDIGVGNIGFNQSNMPLAFDVTWSVKDMNKTMHAPIDIGGGINPFRGIFDDDNAFNDYLNVLSAVSMADQVIPLRRLSHKFALRMAQWDSFWSMGNFTMAFFDNPLGRGVKSAVNLAALTGIPGLEVSTLDRSRAK